MSYRIPLVDTDTKLFPQATMDAIETALDFVTSAELSTLGYQSSAQVDTAIAAYLTAHPPEAASGWEDDPDNPGYLMPS